MTKPPNRHQKLAMFWAGGATKDRGARGTDDAGELTPEPEIGEPHEAQNL
jgi:hypothetical protein